MKPSNRKKLIDFSVTITAIFAFGYFINYLSALITPSIVRFLFPSETSEAPEPDDFDWESLTPSIHLEYHSCYGKFQCARLELPMDWTGEEEHYWDHTVAIALLKIPASVSALDPRYGGEIYVNPGGPGGSGVEFTRRAGTELSQIVSAGSGDSKQFDIIGFDPRGVMHSTPRPTCFPDLRSRQLWYHMTEAYQSPTNSNDTFLHLLARSQAFRKLCDPGSKTTDSELLKQHMSTAYVARDLLAIIDRSAESKSGSIYDKKTSAQSAPGSSKAKLQYWGFSYGTTLGGYFASLFPDRVERMLLDANTHFNNWITGDRSAYITQTDGALRALYSACYAAGKEKCPIWEEDGPEAIESTVHSSLEKLRSSPIPIWKDGMLIPELLTRETVVASMFSSLYVPYRSFPPLAKGLAALKNSTDASALDYFLPKRNFTCSDEVCSLPGCVDKVELFLEVGLAILNGDSTLNGTSEDFFEIASMLQKQSSLFGEKFQVDVATGWNGWPVEPKWRFEGPMGGRTKNPILFIGNTGDPVGPVQNAIKNAKLFDGAVALTQDSPAHGSISAPSLCTAKYIRNYFQDGTLPEPGTVCKPDWLPFEDPPSTYELSGVDMQLSRALQALVNRDEHEGIARGPLF